MTQFPKVSRLIPEVTKNQDVRQADFDAEHIIKSEIRVENFLSVGLKFPLLENHPLGELYNPADSTTFHSTFLIEDVSKKLFSQLRVSIFFHGRPEETAEEANDLDLRGNYYMNYLWEQVGIETYRLHLTTSRKVNITRINSVTIFTQEEGFFEASLYYFDLNRKMSFQ